MYEPRWRVLRVGAIRRTNAILKPRTGNNALHDEGIPVVHRATRRAGKNSRSRVFALIVVCGALSLNSIFAAQQGLRLQANSSIKAESCLRQESSPKPNWSWIALRNSINLTR